MATVTGRYKNALTKYEVASIVTGETTPSWVELAVGISDVDDSTKEKTEDDAFYDGDGTEITTVTSVAEAYKFKGQYNEGDPAQKLIHDLKYETGDGRKIMFRVTEVNGTAYSGTAMVNDIVAGRGGGNAAKFAAFECKITFTAKPTQTPAA